MLPLILVQISRVSPQWVYHSFSASLVLRTYGLIDFGFCQFMPIFLLCFWKWKTCKCYQRVVPWVARRVVHLVLSLFVLVVWVRACSAAQVLWRRRLVGALVIFGFYVISLFPCRLATWRLTYLVPFSYDDVCSNFMQLVTNSNLIRILRTCSAYPV